MRSKEGHIYTVVILGNKQLGDDLKDCLVVSCTNKRSLAEITGIDWNRLVYLFTRKEYQVVLENDCLILKSSSLYKGRQQGGVRNKRMVMGNSRVFSSNQ